MGDIEAMDVDETEVHVDVEMEVILITDMISKIEVLVMVKDSRISSIIEGEAKITRFEGAKDSGMEMILITVTEIIEIEIPMVKIILIGADNGTIIGDRDIVIGEEGEDGIQISNTMTQGINNKTSFQTPIIIVHHRWDINTDTLFHKSNTHTPSNNNISPKCHQDDHNKLQTFASYIIIKAIMIISANLQVISWPAHKKPLIKADHTAIKTLIMGNGHRARLITTT